MSATKSAKAALGAIPTVAWVVAGAAFVAWYLAKRASDAAGKGVDAIVDLLKPGPKIENVNEIAFDYGGAKWFLRRDGRGPFVFSVSSETELRAGWLLVIDGESVEGGPIDYAPRDGRARLTDFPRLVTSRYQFFVTTADGRDPVQVFDFTGDISLGTT